MKLLKEHKSFSGMTEFFEHDSVQTNTKMKFSVSRLINITDVKGALIWLSGLTCNEEISLLKLGYNE